MSCQLLLLLALPHILEFYFKSIFTPSGKGLNYKTKNYSLTSINIFSLLHNFSEVIFWTWLTAPQAWKCQRTKYFMVFFGPLKVRNKRTGEHCTYISFSSNYKQLGSIKRCNARTLREFHSVPLRSTLLTSSKHFATLHAVPHPPFP